MNRILMNELPGGSAIAFDERPGIRFEICKEIGRGASCVVYHAVASDNTEHLLKEYYPKNLELKRLSDGELIIPSDKELQFEKGLLRFREGCERQKAIRLSNEGLKNFTCNVQGYYQANGTEYIDMTCFKGQTYNDVKETSVYNLMLRMRTLAQVVGNYHKAGLLHLDIKPENMYVRPEAETVEDVMLFDFDSVTPVDEVLNAKVLSCTKTWAAPELLLPEKRKSVCQATDIFAIGEIIFVQLFGRHSTSAERRSFVTKFSYNREADIFRNMNPKVFALLDDLLRNTICGVVSKRYQSTDKLIDQIDAIIKISNPREAYLVSSGIQPQEDLCADSLEVEKVREILSDKSLVFLSGAADLSSQLAKTYAQTYRDNYSAIIYMQYDGSLQSLLTDGTSINIMNFTPNCPEDKEAYIEERMQKFADLCDEHVLLLIDNLSAHDFGKSERRSFEYLLSLNCHKIFTTPYDEWPYPVYRVGSFYRPFKIAKLATKMLGIVFVALAVISIGLPVMSAVIDGELVTGNLVFRGVNLIEVSLFGWLVLLIPIALVFVMCDRRLKRKTKATIICGASVLGLIGWVEGLLACYSFYHAAEDLGWPSIEYGWMVGVLSYILIFITYYIHYVGIENAMRNLYYTRSADEEE